MTTIHNLSRDIIGHLLTFFSYRDWAILQRTSKLFWHKDHNKLRTRVKKLKSQIDNENENSPEDFTWMDFETEPFLSFLGTPINPSSEPLKQEIRRVFTKEGRKFLRQAAKRGDLFIEGEAIIQSILGFPITELHVCLDKENLLDILKGIALPIERIIVYSQTIYAIRVECKGGYTIFIDSLDQNECFFFIFRLNRILFPSNTNIIKLLTRGVSHLECTTIEQYKKLLRLGIRVTNGVAMESDLFESFTCQHQNLNLDSRGVHISGIKFTFDHKEDEHGKRFLQLADYNGHKVDLLTNQVYNPKTKAISGVMQKDGTIKKRCIKNPYGDTEYKAISPSFGICGRGSARCDHPFIREPCQRQPRENFLVVCRQAYVFNSVDKLTSSISMRMTKSGTKPCLPKVMYFGEKELHERIFGTRNVTHAFHDIFRYFYSATHENIDWWIEKFKETGGYDKCLKCSEIYMEESSDSDE